MSYKQVFISYKSDEFEQADSIRRMLEGKNISCWMAPMSIPGGSSYASEIPVAIRNCQVFVLILSKQAQRSQWISKELDQAINQKKTILPYMIENCQLTDEFSFYLSNIQRYEGFRNSATVTEKFLHDIYALLGITPEPEKAPAEVPEVRQPIITISEAPKKPSRPAARPKKQKTDSHPPRRRFILIPAILAAVAALAITIFLSNNVTIAGARYPRNTYRLELSDITLSEQDLSKFSKFREMSILQLQDCTLPEEDLSALDVSALYELSLIGCGLTDAQLRSIHFETAARLRELHLNGNPALTDITCLSPLEGRLGALDVSGTSLSSPEQLQSFTQLTTLKVDDLGLADLTPLTTMIYLENLSARNNLLSDLTGLENTTKLTNVVLDGNRLTDISPLEFSAATLKEISLNDNLLTSLDSLAECGSLLHVAADRNQLTTLSPLKNAEALNHLSAAGNAISDLSDIPFTKLRYIDLSDNQLTALDANTLAFEPDAYVSAFFSGNQISTVTLPENCYFSIVDLRSNSISGFDFLSTVKAGKFLLEYTPEMTPDMMKSTSILTVYLTDCPLSEQVAMGESYFVTLCTQEEAEAVAMEKKVN